MQYNVIYCIQQGEATGQADKKKGNKIMSTISNRKSVVIECISALSKGVSSPTIVREDDGSVSYIPDAYLSDGSYGGSTDVVTSVDDEGAFGPDFDIEDESQWEDAAAWAAEAWAW